MPIETNLQDDFIKPLMAAVAAGPETAKTEAVLQEKNLTEMVGKFENIADGKTAMENISSIAQVKDVLNAVAVNGITGEQAGTAVKALYDAVGELQDELTKNRDSWPNTEYESQRQAYQNLLEEKAKQETTPERRLEIDTRLDELEGTMGGLKVAAGIGGGADTLLPFEEMERRLRELREQAETLLGYQFGDQFPEFAARAGKGVEGKLDNFKSALQLADTTQSVTDGKFERLIKHTTALAGELANTQALTDDQYKAMNDFPNGKSLSDVLSENITRLGDRINIASGAELNILRNLQEAMISTKEQADRLDEQHTKGANKNNNAAQSASTSMFGDKPDTDSMFGESGSGGDGEAEAEAATGKNLSPADDLGKAIDPRELERQRQLEADHRLKTDIQDLAHNSGISTTEKDELIAESKGTVKDAAAATQKAQELVTNSTNKHQQENVELAQKMHEITLAKQGLAGMHPDLLKGVVDSVRGVATQMDSTIQHRDHSENLVAQAPNKAQTQTIDKSGSFSMVT